MYVYIKSEPGLWTVGFYKPDGTWTPESDHPSPEEAAKRVEWLNGGGVAVTEKAERQRSITRGPWDPVDLPAVYCPECRFYGVDCTVDPEEWTLPCDTFTPHGQEESS